MTALSGTIVPEVGGSVFSLVGERLRSARLHLYFGTIPSKARTVHDHNEHYLDGMKAVLRRERTT